MKELDDVKAAVANITNVAESAIALIQTIATQLNELVNNTAGDDLPGELESFAQTLNDEAQSLSMAITANTPAAIPDGATDQPGSTEQAAGAGDGDGAGSESGAAGETQQPV